MTLPIRVFSGYDHRLPAGYHVFGHSVQSSSSTPAIVTPLVQHQLRTAGLYWRPTDLKASTPFSLTRFLVPALCDYEGWALFADGSDMLLTKDIAQLWGLRDEAKAVMVVPHDYVPAAGSKFFNQEQHAYPRKNWSSLMLFNCAKCTALTPAAVNTESPAWLHRMEWVADEEIGVLPVEWNFLAGEYEQASETPALIHYTLGQPGVPGSTRTAYDSLWYDAHRDMAALPDIDWWLAANRRTA